MTSFPEPIKNSYSYICKVFANSLELEGEKREENILKVINYLRRGGADQDIASQVAIIINYKCIPPFQAGEVIDKVTDVYQGKYDEEKGLTEEIRNWVCQQVGNFRSTDVNTELGLSTHVNKRKASVVLGRLAQEGLIEKVGNERGHWRVVDRTESVIEWENAEPGGGLALRWPLDLQDRFEVMPGSVVIVAGESNSGKTAFMLNVARLNLATFPTFYFSSSNETNARTLRKRLELFGDPLEKWKLLTALSRAGDFQDVVRPDGLNLIDYLEVHEDFYVIGGKIAAIAEKLRGGVAVIALQKNPGTDFGRGGAMTLDKATAYLSLHRGDYQRQEAHTLKLPKVKYPISDHATTPIRFKLAGGCRFIAV